MHYLSQQIEKTNGAYISQMILIFQEVLKIVSNHETRFNEFCNLSPEAICKVLEWQPTEMTLNVIELRIAEGTFMQYLYDNNRAGILAQTHHPLCSEFEFYENSDEILSMDVEHKQCHTSWLYADTLPELVHKLQHQNSQWLDYDLRTWHRTVEPNKGKRIIQQAIHALTPSNQSDE